MQWPTFRATPGCAFRPLSHRPCASRLYSKSSRSASAESSPLILHMPNTSVYAHGASDEAEPVLHNVSWTIRSNEAWAVINSGFGASKRDILEALLGHRRLHPFPVKGLYPFLSDKDPHHHVRLVSFAHRDHSAGTGFQDYTARYGALRQEHKRTLREVYFPETARPPEHLARPELFKNATGTVSLDEHERKMKHELFEQLTTQLELTGLLDLPVIALSNGQTRKARIVQHILNRPSVLILDEPLTGLDVGTRRLLLDFLKSLHFSDSPHSPHIILGMRHQDLLPEWISHVALISPHRTVKTCTREDMIRGGHAHPVVPTASKSPHARQVGTEVVRMADLNVSYGERHVLRNINWAIRENSRWHLMGANGSGKTTLLAMLTGEHPQSYTQSEHLQLFGRERDRWPAANLAIRIGRVSPELHNAFPRRRGMTVWDVIGTGFNGNFVPQGRLRIGTSEDSSAIAPGSALEHYRLKRMWQVLEGLGPRAWKGRIPDGSYEADEDKEFSKCMFVDLSPGEQGIVLLMRALVGQPPLVMLDEVWSGMDENMVEAAKRYLKDGGRGLLSTQACVVISHWEDEVPWTREDGVQRYLLEDGEGQEVH
ncbi:P-loop containing nucleoside triphosphate hydrolase protein [Sparassis latifolia]